MPPQTVPQLRRKLNLLVAHGPYADRAALAERIGKSRKTLYWWERGDPARGPERVSARGMPALLEAVADALPGLSRDHVLRLLLGPAEDLERYLAAQAAPSLRALIEREADRASGKVFREDGSALSLIRTNRPPACPAQARLKLGQLFRIEFATRARGSFMLALQRSPAGWWIVPADHDGKDRILLPGVGPDGTPYLMREDTEAGRHTFAAIQAMHAFPAEVLAAARDGSMLDRAVLSHLVLDLEARAKADRRVFAIKVEISGPA